jgi:hypothetical protein
VWRWVQRYGPELELRIRRHLKATNQSWRVEETYVKIKGRWCYLYRVIDSAGATIDFLLSAFRDADAAKRLLRKALSDESHPQPRVINTDLAVRPKGADYQWGKDQGKDPLKQMLVRLDSLRAFEPGNRLGRSLAIKPHEAGRHTSAMAPEPRRIGRLTTTFIKAYGISYGGVTRCNREAPAASVLQWCSGNWEFSGSATFR